MALLNQTDFVKNEAQYNFENCAVEKIMIKIEPSDYLDTSYNEFMSEGCVREVEGVSQNVDKIKKEVLPPIYDRKEEGNPAVPGVVLKMESTYEDKRPLSKGLESLISQQQQLALQEILTRDQGLSNEFVSSSLKCESSSNGMLMEDYSRNFPTQLTHPMQLENTLQRVVHANLVNILRSIKIEKKLFNCYHCNFSSNQRSVFKTHMNYHMKEEEEEEIRCPECGNSFSTIYKMREHFRTHTGDKPHKCSICSFSTSYPSSFKYHMRTHLGEKPYACPFCSFRSVSCTMLTRHKRVHTGERPFRCHLCDYRARAKGTLKSHLRTHTGEKPFPCSYCDKAFVTSSALRKHLFIHMQSKEHRCILCDETFTTKGEWRKHILTHDAANRCPHCSSKAGSKVRLKQHLDKNEEGGPFRCKYCGSSFKYKCEFTKHVMEHEEYKPFKCDQCDYRGPSSGSLRFHKRAKHIPLSPRKLECADCNKTYNTKTKLLSHLCVRSQ